MPNKKEIDDLTESVTLGKILGDVAPEVKEKDTRKKLAAIAMYILLIAADPKQADNAGEVIARGLRAAYFLGAKK